LTYASLISTRFLRSRWRKGIAFDAIIIDEKFRVVIPNLPILDHEHVAIVQHEPTSIEPCRDNGVILFPDVVLQD